MRSGKRLNGERKDAGAMPGKVVTDGKGKIKNDSVSLRIGK